MPGLFCFVLFFSLSGLLAQTPTPTPTCGTGGTNESDGGCSCPDVRLDIPDLSVDSIHLQVSGLSAHVALTAKALNLIELNAGVDVSIRNVVLDIVGVHAEAHLVVRLDNVEAIVNDTLAILPGVVDALGGVFAPTPTPPAGRLAPAAFSQPATSVQPRSAQPRTPQPRTPQPRSALAPTRAPAPAQPAPAPVAPNTQRAPAPVSPNPTANGQTTRRVLLSNGDILSQVLNAAGKIVSSTRVGNVLTLGLPVVETRTNEFGQTVKVLRDVDGSLISVLLDSNGNILNASLGN